MKNRIFAIPVRSLSRPAVRPWTCQRCMSDQVSPDLAYSTTSSNEIVLPPPSAPPINPANAGHASVQSSDQTSLKQPEKLSLSSLFRQKYFAQKGQWSEEEHRRRKQEYAMMKRGLGHEIPPQYLVHVDPGALTQVEKKERDHLLKWGMDGHVNSKGQLKNARRGELRGVVVSAGKMDRTVKVRVPGQRWEPRVKKYYKSDTDHLVHDPNKSLVIGDVVALHRLNVAKQVKHVVASIVAPFGKGIDERPPIPTPEERLADYKRKRFSKLERRALRAEAAVGDKRTIKKQNVPGQDAGAVVKPDVTAGNPKTATVERNSKKGAKGQILSDGVLSSGEHQVGPRNDRAKKSKESAMNLERKAENDLLAAKGKDEQLERQGLETYSAPDKA